MPKKAIKKQLKLKSKNNKKIKKNLRSEFLLRNQNSPTDLNLNQNQNQNSIRNILLARSLMNPLGFAPQQYGNISNERRIQQLKNDNQSSTQQLSNDKILIDSLNQQLTQNKSESKNLKKQIKELNRKLEKAVSDREIMQDEVNESERIDEKTHREKLRKQNLERRKAEANRENQIIKDKTQADLLESQIHQEQLTHEQLQKEYMKNHYYKDLEIKQKELQQLKSENAALQSLIKSKDFLDSNKEIEETYKSIEIEKFKNKLLQDEEKKKQEIFQAKIEMDSLPSEKDMEAVTQQHILNMDKLNRKQIDVEDRIKTKKIPIGTYNHIIEEEEKLNNSLIDAQNEEFKLYAEQDVINQKIEANKENLDKNLKILGNQIAENELTNNANLQLKNEFENKRKAEFENAKSKANLQFQNTPEIKQINNEIIQTQASVIKLQRETDQQNLLAKQQKEAQKAMISEQVSQKTIDNGLSSVEQASYLIQNELQPRIQNIQQKEQIAQRMNELIQAHQTAWSAYISMHPDIQNVAGSNYKNASLDELNQLYRDFEIFARSFQPPPNSTNQNADDF